MHMKFDDSNTGTVAQRTSQRTAQRSHPFDRPIAYFCEAPDGWSWDDVVPYRPSDERGGELNAGSRGFGS